MTEEIRVIRVPEWDLGDRLKKSLRVAQMTALEMAEYLDVQPSTLTTWFNMRVRPSTATLRAWSMATGVPFEWLASGFSPPSIAESDEVRRQGLEPRTRWLRAADSLSAPFFPTSVKGVCIGAPRADEARAVAATGCLAGATGPAGTLLADAA